MRNQRDRESPSWERGRSKAAIKVRLRGRGEVLKRGSFSAGDAKRGQNTRLDLPRRTRARRRCRRPRRPAAISTGDERDRTRYADRTLALPRRGSQPGR